MNINHIDLRHLRYFLAVAEELNFSRAAVRLHISQPPLSRQIKELEEQLETALFIRTKRSVRLTPAGLELLPRVRRLIDDLQNDFHATQSVGRGKTGELKIGTIFSAPLVPAFTQCIHRFRKTSGQTRLVFREMVYAKLLEGLAANQIDMAFAWQVIPLTDKNLRSCQVADDLMSLYLPKNHPLAKKKQLSITDIANEALYITTLQLVMPFFQALQKMAHQADVSMNIMREHSHFPVIANLIAAECGIGVLPDYIAKLATANLVKAEIKGMPAKTMQLKLALIYRADNDKPQLKEFVACAAARS